MPWLDWQFYLVSLIGLVGLWFLVRPFLPSAGRDDGSGGGACPGCGSGKAAQRAKKKKASLTLEGTPVKSTGR